MSHAATAATAKTENAPSEFAIVDIIRVVDTREVIEDGDRFIRVPGSGESHQCERCDRPHEVHVYAQLADGSTAIIGVSCAKEPFLVKTVRSLLSRERTIKRVRAELTAFEAAAAAWDAAYAAVAQLPLPEVIVTQPPEEHRTRMRMGDAEVWSFESVTVERQKCLIESWRGKRMVERGFNSWRPIDPVDLPRKLAKLLKSPVKRQS